MRRWNMQALIEGLSNWLLAIIVAYLIYSNHYLYIVTPKAKLFLIGMVIVLSLWGLLAFTKSRHVTYKNTYFHCIPLLLLIIILGMPLVYSKSLSVYSLDTWTTAPNVAKRPIYLTHDEYMAATKEQQSGLNKAIKPKKSGANIMEKNITKNSKENSPSPYVQSINGIHDDGIDTVNHIITLTSDNFYNTLLKVHNNLDNYKGYEIIVTGFISREDRSLEGAQFKLARLLMICCIADIAPFGLTCDYEGDILPDKSWYTIKGVIAEKNYRGMRQPLVHIQILQPASPIEGFVYPY